MTVAYALLPQSRLKTPRHPTAVTLPVAVSRRKESGKERIRGEKKWCQMDGSVLLDLFTSTVSSIPTFSLITTTVWASLTSPPLRTTVRPNPTALGPTRVFLRLHPPVNRGTVAELAWRQKPFPQGSITVNLGGHQNPLRWATNIKEADHTTLAISSPERYKAEQSCSSWKLDAPSLFCTNTSLTGYQSPFKRHSNPMKTHMAPWPMGPPFVSLKS